MRGQILFAVLCILMIFIVGCKKDKVPEQTSCVVLEFPGEYFPAYPKSWWNYRDNFNQLINYQISDEYQECEAGCLPLFINIDKCVKGNSLIYSYYCGLGTVCNASSMIYSLNKDQEFISPISFSTFQLSAPGQEPDFRRKTVVLDTTLVINTTTYQNVIIVKEYDVTNSDHKYFDYFSKNIGLIKRDSVSVSDSTELIPILILENYSIGN